VKLRQIRNALAVAKFGSLRAAARHLGMEQPSITRSIQDIERELGAALFERHSQGVLLTPIGRAFLKRASVVESELQRMREEVDQLKGLSTGSITIAFSIASSIALMSEALSPFYHRFPDAELKFLETLFSPVENDVLEGHVDAYIGTLDRSTSVSPRLVVEKLFDNQRVIIARRNHPLMRAKSIDALNSAQWVWLLASPGFETDHVEWLRLTGLEHPRTVLRTGSALQTVLAVSASDLLAMVPRQWLELPALAERVCAIPVVPAMISPPVCLVRQRNIPPTPMAEHFCDIVRRLSRAYEKRSVKVRGGG
jgi:LysR family transcriptional regulator, regulator of abg operon